jgi:hypothetical protein
MIRPPQMSSRDQQLVKIDEPQIKPRTRNDLAMKWPKPA